MTLIKEIKIECLTCGWSHQADNSSEEYEKLLELEHCPGCLERITQEV